MPRGPGLPSAYRTWTSMMPPAGRPLPAPPPIPRCARSEEAERQKSNRGSKTCEERRDIRYLQGLDRGRGKKGRSYEFTEAQVTKLVDGRLAGGIDDVKHIESHLELHALGQLDGIFEVRIHTAGDWRTTQVAAAEQRHFARVLISLLCIQGG